MIWILKYVFKYSAFCLENFQQSTSRKKKLEKALWKLRCGQSLHCLSLHMFRVLKHSRSYIYTYIHIYIHTYTHIYTCIYTVYMCYDTISHAFSHTVYLNLRSSYDSRSRLRFCCKTALTDGL